MGQARASGDVCKGKIPRAQGHSTVTSTEVSCHRAGDDGMDPPEGALVDELEIAGR